MKLFKTKVEKFILKRVLILFCVLTIIDIITMANKWYIFGGMLAGGILSLLRLKSLAFILSKIKPDGTSSRIAAQSVLGFIISQLAAAALLVSAALINSWALAGTLIGVLLVPAIIMLNGITEGLNITHNNFE